MEKNNSIILQVDESTKKMMAEVESAITYGVSSKISELENKLSEIQNSVDNLKSKLRYIADIQDTIDSLSKKSDDIGSNLEAVKNAISATLKIKIEPSDVEQMEEQVKKRDLQEVLTQINIAIGKINDEDNRLSSMEIHLKDAIETYSKIVDGLYSSICKSIEDSSSNLQQTVEKICAKIDFSENNLKEQNISTQSKLDSLFTDTQQKVNVLEEKLTSGFCRTEEVVSNAISNIEKTHSTEIQSASDLIFEQLEKCKIMIARNDELIKSLGTSTSDFATQIIAKVSETQSNTKDEIVASSAKTDSLIKESTQSIESKLSDMSSEVDSGQAKSLQEIENLKNLCSDISKQIKNLSENVSSEFSESKDRHQKIQSVLNDILYHSISFWQFKSKKQAKMIKEHNHEL